MKSDENFWHTVRPLNEQMLEYAAQDVIFLPLVFEEMQKHMSVPYIERRYDHRGITFENMTVM